MRIIYQPWDGEEFPTQDHLAYFPQFMEFVLDHGDDALDALKDVEQDPEQAAILEQWIKDGLLERVGARFRLTPRAIDSMQRKALMEVFRNMKPGSAEGHETPHKGAGGERTLDSRPYQWGDDVADVDPSATLRAALGRQGPQLPLPLAEEDFKLFERESKATCSTVILLDMSGSMSRWNRFREAKRCAMAIYALIRQRFALDTVDVVGFGSLTEPLPEHKLALAMPKEISIYDPVVEMRVPLSRADDAPQHFTNLQLALRAARQLLARRAGINKQVFIITDGQPTAHVEGDRLVLLYPPRESTTMATLSEALMLSRQGVRFSTFALVEDYGYMDWVRFVDQLTRLTRGVAFYTSAAGLSQCVMESYLSGRKRRSYLA